MTKKNEVLNLEKKQEMCRRKYLTAVESANRALVTTNKASWKVAEVINSTVKLDEFSTLFGDSKKYAEYLGIARSTVDKSCKAVETRDMLVNHVYDVDGGIPEDFFNNLTVSLAQELGYAKQLGSEDAICEAYEYLFFNDGLTVAGVRRYCKDMLVDKQAEEQGEEQVEEQAEEVNISIPIYVEYISWDDDMDMYAGYCNGRARCYIPASVLEPFKS